MVRLLPTTALHQAEVPSISSRLTYSLIISHMHMSVVVHSTLTRLLLSGTPDFSVSITRFTSRRLSSRLTDSRTTVSTTHRHLRSSTDSSSIRITQSTCSVLTDVTATVRDGSEAHATNSPATSTLTEIQPTRLTNGFRASTRFSTKASSLRTSSSLRRHISSIRTAGIIWTSTTICGRWSTRLGSRPECSTHTV